MFQRALGSPVNFPTAPCISLVVILFCSLRLVPELLCGIKPTTKPNWSDWTWAVLFGLARSGWRGFRGEGGQRGGSTAPVLFQTKLESPNQAGWVESTQRPPWKIRASLQHIPPAVDRYELQKSILCPFSREYVRDGESVQTEDLTEQRIPLIGIQPQSRGVL